MSLFSHQNLIFGGLVCGRIDAQVNDFSRGGVVYFYLEVIEEDFSAKVKSSV